VLSRALIFFVILFTSVLSFAAQCLMAEALKDPKLAQNGKFWEEYGILAAKGEVPTDQMKALIEKHGGLSSNPVVQNAKVVPKSLDLNMSHKAKKEVQALAKELHGKFDEFLEIALKPGGIQEFYDNPGRWRPEKLHDGTHTVRLNDGHRVKFVKEGDSIEVIRVNAVNIHK
jgi:hypothetical protein